MTEPNQVRIEMYLTESDALIVLEFLNSNKAQIYGDKYNIERLQDNDT